MKISQVTQPNELEQLVSRILADARKSDTLIGLDTEFWRVRTYWPQLCLVQIFFAGTVYIVDPLAIDVSPLVPVLTARNVIKVMHAGDQDCEIFMHDFTIVPVRVMDTQIAARMLDMGRQIGYAGLVRDVLEIAVDKSEQHGKWRARPLTQEQITYAGRDVIYLPKLYAYFVQKLATPTQISHWERLTSDIIAHVHKMQDPDRVWQRWDTTRYNETTRERLKIVASYRERKAQEKNLPRTRLFTDEALVNLVTNPVTSKRDLRLLRGMSPLMGNDPMLWEILTTLAPPPVTNTPQKTNANPPGETDDGTPA